MQNIIVSLSLIAVFISTIGFFIGLGMLIFAKDKKNALAILVFSVIVWIVGFGSCASMFTF